MLGREKDGNVGQVRCIKSEDERVLVKDEDLKEGRECYNQILLKTLKWGFYWKKIFIKEYN